ncbi:YceI family protein [Corynebacterium atrinae]|uniref:YceI family protein n=1 Tax=Corynebacterium atrinae TaxID=1336740 RepID=UPI0025B374FF|nr:YceI family protein [Corynebacterium atrinae]
MPTSRKLVISLFVVLIIILALVAVVPMVYSAFMGPGVRTEGLSTDDVKPASTDINGEWEVARGGGANATSVGYTFFEILPGERKNTSGSTSAVGGFATIEAGTLTAGSITVDMTKVSSDNERRDINVRNKILNTDQFPDAVFTVTEPVDLSAVPSDGRVVPVKLIGDLEVRGESRPLVHDFDVVRDGDRIIVSGDIRINRHDYGVESPEFVAAKIDEEGELNIRVALEKIS